MSFEISDGGHDFEDKVVGYEKPSEPRWVQEIVQCYCPTIRRWTCKKCNYSFQGRDGIFLMMLTMGMPKCPGVPTYPPRGGLPVIDPTDP